MDITAAIIEVASATRKPMRVIAYSRSQVVGALLTLPELQGNKQQAMKIAQVVWDMQGKVDAKQPAVRAQFVEVMAQAKRTAPAKIADLSDSESVSEAIPEPVLDAALKTSEQPGPVPLLQVT